VEEAHVGLNKIYDTVVEIGVVKQQGWTTMEGVSCNDWHNGQRHCIGCKGDYYINKVHTLK
jgi:hypothetical protein